MSKILIVMYHYVRDIKFSRFSSIKGLETDSFHQQLLYLKKHYNLITMEQLLECIRNNTNLPNKAALLTFDDGYLDHYLNVFPLLEKYNLKGCFYVPTNVIKNNVLLDVNKIHLILAKQTDTNVLIEDIKNLIQYHKSDYKLKSFEFYYSTLAKPGRLDHQDIIFIKRLLQVELVEELRKLIIEILFNKYVNVSEAILNNEFYMNEEQILHLHNSGHHIGCHGNNHVWWNRLSKDELGKEIDISLGYLRELGISLSNWTACYPYGGYNIETIELLKNKGCNLALTTKSNISCLNSNSLFELPRVDTNEIPMCKEASTNRWYHLQ